MATKWEFNPTTSSAKMFWPLRNDTIITKPKQVLFPCNNPDNFIDEATAKQVELIFHMSVLPLLQFLGVMTNFINCLVFARQGLKDRINLCLFSLALADLFFLLMLISVAFVKILSQFNEDLGTYWIKRLQNTLLGPIQGTVRISNLMTMIISLERCICVLAPFTAKKFLKTRYMTIIIVTMSLYILGIYSLLNMKYVTLRIINPVTNSSRWVSRLSTFYLDNRTVIDILYNHLMTLSIPCLSLVVVIVATSLTVIKLSNALTWRHESGHQKTSLGDKSEMAVTKMLAVICFIYVATITPSVTQRFFRTFVPGYLPSGRYCNTFKVVQVLAQMCEVTNSSVNFIVYFTMGSRFRDTLRELMGSRTNTSRSTSLPSVNHEI